MRNLAQRFRGIARYSNFGTARYRRGVILGALVVGAILMAFQGALGQQGPLGRLLSFIPNGVFFPNPKGASQTYSAKGGGIDETGPFFQSLGTNGRTCGTCHVAENAMGLSAQHAQLVFAATDGHDPLFADVDGANCPNAAPGDPAAHSLLIGHGLIRIALQVPANAQFQIRAIHDPYGCAIVTDPVSGAQTVSVYRRPLPATNLVFLSSVMADGRETVAPLNNPATFQANLLTDLKHQAMDATTGHAQASVPPTDAQQTAMANFELGLFSAQAFDFNAGPLTDAGAQGAPVYLSQQAYHPGINDTLGQDPSGAPFNPDVFTIFNPWAKATTGFGVPTRVEKARQAIAAGEAIFNSHPLTISNVRGLNDNPAVAAALGTSLPVPAFQGTCTTCHDAPNVGNHSLPVPLDIGTVHDPVAETDPSINNALSQLTLPDVPIYEITGCPNPFASAGDTSPYLIYTTDPGKALISGQCGDINRTKGPILRGLAARAPYFHNGAARNLRDVVNFYDQRFQIGLTDEEKAQLVAFLSSL